MISFYKALVVIGPPMGFCFQAVLVHGDYHQCRVLALFDDSRGQCFHPTLSLVFEAPPVAVRMMMSAFNIYPFL